MSESDSSEAPIPAKKVRRSFTIEKKLEVVAYAKFESIHSASKKYKVDRKNIRDWKDDEKKCLKRSIWSRMLRMDTPATIPLILMNDCIN